MSQTKEEVNVKKLERGTGLGARFFINKKRGFKNQNRNRVLDTLVTSWYEFQATKHSFF